jgi:ATP-dependent helicase HepA
VDATVGLGVGSLVEHPHVPGIGRVGVIDGQRVRVDCFESVADPLVDSRWVPSTQCRQARLLAQTRVYWQNPDTGDWHVGRIVGGEPPQYFVRLPSSDLDFRVPESQLRVRWDRPIRDPVDVLAAGANESAYFRDARLSMLYNLVAQRAACGDMPTLLSSAIEIFPHQIHAALTIASDPIQRYLLADEVGLGKTIEAGLIIRQVLLDEPHSKITVIAPDSLRRQWREELLEKFFIDDFPVARFVISAHKTPEKWADYHESDLLVVDEAHRLVQVDEPGQSPYRELASLAHSARRVLLLSATPVTSRITTHLGLLHLLDCDLYRWEDRKAFERRFELRKQLANAVYALDAEFEVLLPSAISEVEALIPADVQFRQLADSALKLLTPEGELRQEDDRRSLGTRVEALRAHISETYRLHRRMIRHRRSQVLASAEENEQSSLPFELTGRRVPEAILLDTVGQQLAQDCLLRWQSGVARWLRDHGSEDQWKAYGQVLAVLVSRADSVSGDLADALRWRLAGEVAAATRAGLTLEERSLMRGPVIVPAESAALELLAEGGGREDELKALADVLLPVLRSHRRVTLFCGPGTLAEQLSDFLRRRIPAKKLAEHTRRQKADACQGAVTQWRKEGGVLVVDDSAEDGLNLQDADAAVHCRLPRSPNQLEQRIGRVDRYGADIARDAANQFVITSPDGEHVFLGAWLSLLAGAFSIFSQSVSALQETIDEGLAAIWAAGVADGPEGLIDLAPQIREDLTAERREIDGMDMLEAVHDSASGFRDIAASIGMLEMNWRGIESAVVAYAGRGSGGLGFSHRGLGPRQQVTQFERGSAAPLLAPRIFALADTVLSPATMRGGFNRTSALRIPGIRLFRIGNPLIDVLAGAVAVDDRGQASAFARRDVSVRGEAEVYFGLDFLVEADTDEAQQLTGEESHIRAAIRRQADRIFEPFMHRVWVPAGGDSAVGNPELLEWLNRPYAPDRGDINLNPARITPLLDLFGGPGKFADVARSAERTSRRELARVSDMSTRCDEAQNRAAQALAVQYAQAQARHAAGRITADTESYLADVRVADALISGLRRPHVKVVGVVCLVRGNLGTVGSAS